MIEWGHRKTMIVSGSWNLVLMLVFTWIIVRWKILLIIFWRFSPWTYRKYERMEKIIKLLCQNKENERTEACSPLFWCGILQCGWAMKIGLTFHWRSKHHALKLRRWKWRGGSWSNLRNSYSLSFNQAKKPPFSFLLIAIYTLGRV